MRIANMTDTCDQHGSRPEQGFSNYCARAFLRLNGEAVRQTMNFKSCREHHFSTYSNRICCSHLRDIKNFSKQLFKFTFHFCWFLFSPQLKQVFSISATSSATEGGLSTVSNVWCIVCITRLILEWSNVIRTFKGSSIYIHLFLKRSDLIDSATFKLTKTGLDKANTYL